MSKPHILHGRLIKRPSKKLTQAEAEHWERLKIARREVQRGSDGLIHCGTCSLDERQTRFDLHHRYYCRFGQERLEDVILLCKTCHTAITSRIRDARYAAGERHVDLMPVAIESRFVPQERPALQITPEPVQERIKRFIPNLRKIGA